MKDAQTFTSDEGVTVTVMPEKVTAKKGKLSFDISLAEIKAVDLDSAIAKKIRNNGVYPEGAFSDRTGHKIILAGKPGLEGVADAIEKAKAARKVKMEKAKRKAEAAGERAREKDRRLIDAAMADAPKMDIPQSAVQVDAVYDAGWADGWGRWIYTLDGVEIPNDLITAGEVTTATRPGAMSPFYSYRIAYTDREKVNAFLAEKAQKARERKARQEEYEAIRERANITIGQYQYSRPFEGDDFEVAVSVTTADGKRHHTTVRNIFDGGAVYLTEISEEARQLIETYAPEVVRFRM